MKIAYVTDSGTGKSIAEMAKDGIISVPLQISDEKNTYQDLENLSKSDLIHLLEEEHVFKTSQPSPGIIQECFESLKKQGVDLIIAVPICNGLSGDFYNDYNCEIIRFEHHYCRLLCHCRCTGIFDQAHQKSS